MSNKISRPLDSVGRVVIPKDIREMLNWNNGDYINISVTDTGVTLTKEIEGCEECGEKFGLVKIGKHAFCRKCVEGALS